MELESIRKEIDSIDREILHLVAKRMKLAGQIAEIKQNLKLPLEDKEREVQLLEARIKTMKELGFDDAEFIKAVYAVIIKKSKGIQKEVNK